MHVEINYLAVILSTVASMLIGYIWYHPEVFGTTWLKMAKIKPENGDMGWSMGSAIFSSLVMAYVLAHFVFIMHFFFNDSYLLDSLTTALWAWIGFQGLRVFQRDQFNQKRKKESAIHMSNDFVTIMVMALIIGLVGI